MEEEDDNRVEVESIIEEEDDDNMVEAESMEEDN